MSKTKYYYTKTRVILACYLIVISHLHIHGSGVHIPAFFLFGDSVMDTGNNNYLFTTTKADFPPYGRDFDGGLATGRFSNGKVPSDLIAEEFGIKEYVPPYLDPTLNINDLLTGVSFASGSSGYDPESAISANVLTLEDQLNLFKDYINKLKLAVGENTTQTIISESIYTVCAGSNDVTNFFTPFRNVQDGSSSYTSRLVTLASTFIQKLHSLGARRIGVISIPPSGCLPSQTTLGGGLFRQCVDEENKVAILFNEKLYSELGSLRQQLSGSRLVYMDSYTPLLNLITNPSQYGFEVADRGCCGTGIIEAAILCNQLDPGTCKDASKYIFWDSYHPTETTYRIIVHQIMQKNKKDFF